MNKSLSILYFVLFTLSAYCQDSDSNKISYVVWLSEFKKGWIDSENGYYLLESKNDADFALPEKSFTASLLLIADEYDFQICCGSINPKEHRLLGERDFFNQKETFTTKYKDITIRITALNQISCKCTAQTISKNSESRTLFSIIKESTFLKLEKQQKKNIAKNKIRFIEYLKKIEK